MSDDKGYQRVLVIGSKKVGKTNLLSTLVCGDNSPDYVPTQRVEKYYDCKRRLQLIDTPGLDDAILSWNKNGPLLDFNKDPAVQEFLNTSEIAETENKIISIPIETIRAYVIVHSQDQITFEMATKLYDAIEKTLNRRHNSNRSNTDRRAKIWMVRNKGDIPRKQAVLPRSSKKRARKGGKEKGKNAKDPENKIPPGTEWAHITDEDGNQNPRFAHFKVVCSKSYLNVEKLFNEIATDLNLNPDKIGVWDLPLRPQMANAGSGRNGGSAGTHLMERENCTTCAIS